MGILAVGGVIIMALEVFTNQPSNYNEQATCDDFKPLTIGSCELFIHLHELEPSQEQNNGELNMVFQGDYYTPEGEPCGSLTFLYDEDKIRLNERFKEWMSDSAECNAVKKTDLNIHGSIQSSLQELKGEKCFEKQAIILRETSLVNLLWHEEQLAGGVEYAKKIDEFMDKNVRQLKQCIESQQIFRFPSPPEDYHLGNFEPTESKHTYLLPV